MQDKKSIDKIIARIQCDDLFQNVHSADTTKLLLNASTAVFLKTWSGLEQTDSLKLLGGGITDDATLETLIGRLMKQN
jgi:hypothetical protein